MSKTVYSMQISYLICINMPPIHVKCLFWYEDVACPNSMTKAHHWNIKYVIWRFRMPSDWLTESLGIQLGSLNINLEILNK